jgi:Protein of unknown function (DUF2934)
MPVMLGPTEEEIRVRAYLLWKASGERGCRMDIFGIKLKASFCKNAPVLARYRPA